MVFTFSIGVEMAYWLSTVVVDLTGFAVDDHPTRNVVPPMSVEKVAVDGFARYAFIRIVGYVAVH